VRALDDRKSGTSSGAHAFGSMETNRTCPRISSILATTSRSVRSSAGAT
jgi:hypothetical protein